MNPEGRAPWGRQQRTCWRARLPDAALARPLGPWAPCARPVYLSRLPHSTGTATCAPESPQHPGERPPQSRCLTHTCLMAEGQLSAFASSPGHWAGAMGAKARLA